MFETEAILIVGNWGYLCFVNSINSFWFKAGSILCLLCVGENVLCNISLIKRGKLFFQVVRMSIMLFADLQMAVLSSFSVLVKNFLFTPCITSQSVCVTVFSRLLYNHCDVTGYNTNLVWIMRDVMPEQVISAIFSCNVHADINTMFVTINVIYSWKYVSITSAVFAHFSRSVLCCTAFSSLSPERTSWKVQYSWLTYVFFIYE